MKTLVCLVSLLAGLLAPGSPAIAATSPGGQDSRPQLASSGAGVVEHGQPSGWLAKAEPDTSWLFGGPGTDEGKFQVGLVPDRGGWLGVDRTDQPVHWQRSTFNAANLNGHGSGNVAAWSGRSADQEPGWVTAPGYGNGWADGLLCTLTVSDPTQPQVVGLDFFFNHDTEYGYDYFTVQFDSADTWIDVYRVDGSNQDASGVFPTPGLQFSTVDAAPIQYAGSDYAGDGGDEIRIRLLVTSDGAWSDEDGMWPSDGAVQVDDIAVTTSDGVTYTDFEVGFGDWRLDKAQFVGDFSAVYPAFDDLDPCRENDTPVVAFVDRGQELCSNDCLPGSPSSTGGTTSRNWSYGFPGGWVVNYNGGLTFGETNLFNQIWSPAIAWDLPGTADDGPGAVGVLLSFDVWEHLPLSNGLFWLWHVRSTPSLEAGVWGPWESRNFVYYNGLARWQAVTRDVTDLMVEAPEGVQIALGVYDLAANFAFPGDDATPSPVFDNVGLRRYRIGGPLIVTRTIDLANDGFPVSGSIDASTSVARDGLDIPFDMARDVSTGTVNVPGDSIIVDVTSRIAGADVADIRMKWVLDKNPLFEDAIRVAPARIQDENVDTSDPDRWFGDVLADSSRNSAGALIKDRFFFDLPDVDFLYPGDRLRYHLQTTDSDGRVSTLPPDLTGFTTGEGWNRTYQVYGLPSLSDDQGTQPSRLVINDFGRRGGEQVFLSAMGQLGLREGVHYDTYTVQGPSSLVSNGIGSAGAHGANADQLAGYDTLVYLAGNLANGLLSSGDPYDWSSGDKGDDLGVVTAWHGLPGGRHAVWFGDNIASAHVGGSAAGALFVQTILGVSLNDSDVRNEIEGQTAPIVLPLQPAFATSFVAFGGCLGINQFDSVAPLAPAVRGHGFATLADPNSAYAGLAASIVHDRVDGLGDRKVDITFPFGLIYVYDRNDRSRFASGPSARTRLLSDVFDHFGWVGPIGPAVSAPVARRADLRVHPSPFNPRTTVSLSVPRAGLLRVEIYDLRGRRVRTLFAGEAEAPGELRWTWEGCDDGGAERGQRGLRDPCDGRRLHRSAEGGVGPLTGRRHTIHLDRPGPRGPPVAGVEPCLGCAAAHPRSRGVIPRSTPRANRATLPPSDAPRPRPVPPAPGPATRPRRRGAPMDRFRIEGPCRLEGSVRIGGAKNAVLPLMAATLLTRGVSRIHNVPQLRDTRTMARVLETLGAKVRFDDHLLEVDTSDADGIEAPYDLVKTMRASIYVLGPTLAARGRARVSLPGGCAWGPRPVDLHLSGMEALGATIELESGYIVATVDRLEGAEISFEISSVGATANVLMAAVLAKGHTVLENAAREPEVTQLAEALVDSGAMIDGIGTTRLEIEGVDEIRALEVEVIPDRIEAGTFLAAAPLLRSRLEILGARPDHLESTIEALAMTGCAFEIEGDTIVADGRDADGPLNAVTRPFPGFPTDMQAQTMAVACRMNGISVLVDTIYPDRFTHVAELRRLGANIRLDGNSAVVRGVERLKGAPVMATDLRASAALIIAGLAAEGTTMLDRVYHIDRGYERIEEKLRALGARIERVEGPPTP